VAHDIDLQEANIDLISGISLVLYTDGITEAINDQEEAFGWKAHRIIRSHGALSAKI